MSKLPDYKKLPPEVRLREYPSIGWNIRGKAIKQAEAITKRAARDFNEPSKYRQIGSAAVAMAKNLFLQPPDNEVEPVQNPRSLIDIIDSLDPLPSMPEKPQVERRTGIFISPLLVVGYGYYPKA